MEFLDRKYNASDVGRTNKMSIQRLNSWHERGLITGLKDLEGAGKQGRNRRYSFYNVMEVAIAKALIDQGLNVKMAFKAAQMFAHSGADGRKMSLPLHHKIGQTYLAADNKTGKSQIGIMPETDAALFIRSIGIALGNQVSWAIVDVSELFMDVSLNCGVNYRKVLDEAYPEAATD